MIDKQRERGPHWLTAIEDLKPGDACEFRYPARSEWLPAIVETNGGSGFWIVRRTSSDADGEASEDRHRDLHRARAAARTG